MIVRFFISIMLVGAVFFVPWWSVCLAGLIAAASFRQYYELAILGYLLDMMYMQPPIQFAFTVGAVVSVCVAAYVHSHLRATTL